MTCCKEFKSIAPKEDGIKVGADGWETPPGGGRTLGWEPPGWEREEPEGNTPPRGWGQEGARLGHGEGRLRRGSGGGEGWLIKPMDGSGSCRNNRGGTGEGG